MIRHTVPRLPGYSTTQAPLGIGHLHVEIVHMPPERRRERLQRDPALRDLHEHGACGRDSLLGLAAEHGRAPFGWGLETEHRPDQRFVVHRLDGALQTSLAEINQRRAHDAPTDRMIAARAVRSWSMASARSSSICRR